MASASEIEWMSKSTPPGVRDLATVVSNGPAYGINVMGVVHDCMAPSQTRGTDMQITFRLCDKSLLVNGMRFKFFRKTAEQLPRIHGVGDVVLLRNIKVTRFKNELLGLSSFDTEHIVFPKDSIPSTGYRVPFGTHSGQLPHTRSEDTSAPSLHEQQWAISLKDHFAFATGVSDMPSDTANGPENSTTPNASTTTPISAQSSSSRNKYSLIKNVTAGDKHSSFGNFYDLAGEVVKMFFNSFGYLDLYICDYTVNRDLHNYDLSGLNERERKSWQGPAGQMTLHVELQQPHASWTQGNIKEGDLVFLKNVRIKWNQRGSGDEIEGNLWSDKFYPDKVCVHRLAEAEPQYGEIQGRKTSYHVNVVGPEGARARKRRKNQSKQRRAKRQRQDETSILNDQTLSASDDESEGAAASENGPTPVVTLKNKGMNANSELPETAHETPALTTTVDCAYSDVPLSSFAEILHSPDHFITSSDGESIKIPFNNVKHRARFRVVDFFPHSLSDFAVYDLISADPTHGTWNWCFWLSLVSPQLDDTADEVLNVLVEGKNAQELLQLDAVEYEIPSTYPRVYTNQARSLSSDSRRLKALEETLFLLWGELAEKKEKFLHSHPRILPDESFSARAYNIKTETPPFVGCIAEYGVLLDEHRAAMTQSVVPNARWIKMFKLFGTKIKR